MPDEVEVELELSDGAYAFIKTEAERLGMSIEQFIHQLIVEMLDAEEEKNA